MKKQMIFLSVIISILSGFQYKIYAQEVYKELYDGYLFAYFEGSGDKNKQEQLRFAYSSNAVNWYALNNNQPIIPSDKISQTGGIRDPHILRGQDDGNFYMVATDMFTMKNGWGSNPGIVMMKSGNLVDWKHNIIDLAKLYPGTFGNVKWVWAPQTVYDPEVNKYLVYFTIRFHDDKKLDFYSAYANEDFTGFETEPTLMFRAKDGAIDGDIIYKDGTYHLFYKGNSKDKNGKENKNGIKQATAKGLKGPWKESFDYIDVYAQTPTVVEGSSIFKLNNSDEYILMYDLYTAGRYEFQRSKDLYNFTQEPESFTKNFHPRHGSVISITREEAYRLNMKWGGIPQEALSGMYHFTSKGNPLITHKFTADPAAMVKGDTLWLYTGHDFAGGQKGYKMKDWSIFSTTDLKNWTEYPTPMQISDFSWAKSGDAYAAHIVERNGKYYWYISTNWSGIGVAVSDRPEGPFKDALGKPLLTNDDCFASTHYWACIDPAIFIDDDGQAWIFWGNRECYYAKLKDNMIEIDGEVKLLEFKDFRFTEAPWAHKYKGKYYLTYATEFPEKIAYAIADHIEGPYEYKGILNEIAGNSNTNHQAIVEFKNQWYFIYHNGAINTGGGSYSRSVCIDSLHYNSDGTMKRMVMTTEGVTPVNHNNPLLSGYYADPEVMYSNKTKKYYIYPTSDGFKGWSGTYFRTFSSSDLKTWKDEGVILDLNEDVTWADRNAWAPCIEEKKMKGQYKYFYYFTAAQKIGVAVADDPAGPFIDSGKPLIDFKPDGVKGGQEIDPDVFTDPKSGKSYLFWGNGYCAVAELNSDMVSIKKNTIKVITPDKTFREGIYIIYRKGIYYFFWSEDDTRSPNYRVRYGTSKSPLGPISVPENNLILSKNEDSGIYATGHNSILQIPGKDEWYIVYHRFKRPEGIHMGREAGYHREVCMDKLEFNEDGSIQVVKPTL